MLDSCKFQGFVAKFSRYLPLSGGGGGRKNEIIATNGACHLSPRPSSLEMRLLRVILWKLLVFPVAADLLAAQA